MDIQQEQHCPNSIISIPDAHHIQLQNTQLKRPCYLNASEHGSIDFVFKTMTIGDFENLHARIPFEIVIIGLETPAFIDESLRVALYKKNISIEVMNTRSACYAFNILLDELRPVVLILL